MRSAKNMTARALSLAVVLFLVAALIPVLSFAELSSDVEATIEPSTATVIGGDPLDTPDLIVDAQANQPDTPTGTRDSIDSVDDAQGSHDVQDGLSEPTVRPLDLTAQEGGAVPLDVDLTATTVTVDNPVDLLDVVANGVATTVNLAPGSYQLAPVLGNPDAYVASKGYLVVNRSITFASTGAGATILNNPLSRHMYVYSNSNANITLAFANVALMGNNGGGIHFQNISGTLTLNGAVVQGCTANDPDRASGPSLSVYNGGGLNAPSATANMVLNACTFANNTASNGDGGAVYAGGSLANIRTEGVTFQNNSASSGYYWNLDSTSAPVHATHIINTTYTTPFRFAYNNVDISYRPTNRAITYNSNIDGVGPFITGPYYSGEPFGLYDVSDFGWSKPDYIFMGWSLSQTGTMASLYDKPSVFGSQDVALYAVWAEARYTVNYNINGGTPASIAAKTGVKWDDTGLIPTQDPSRVGHAFAGWNVTLGGSGTKVRTADAYAGLAASERTFSITLTAQWTANVYTVRFLDWNGTVRASQNVAYGLAAATPPNPTRAGYTFAGWDRGYGFITAATDVYANYLRNPPPPPSPSSVSLVRFLDWDGGVLLSATVTSGAAATAPAAPTRAGYTFTGWDKAFGVVTSDLDVTALYEPELTPTPDGPNDPAADPDVLTIPSAPTPSAPAIPAPGPADGLVNYAGEGLSPADERMIAAQTGNPLQDIAAGNVPLGNLATTAVWSFLNLLLATCCVAGYAALQIGVIRRRTYTLAAKALRYAAMAFAVVTVIVWLILDQLQKPLALVDAYTPIIATLFATVALLALIFNIIKGSSNLEDIVV